MQAIEQFTTDNKITMETKFIPYSKTKGAKPYPKLSDLTLNWEVTILVNGRPILTTDYMMGVGHAPSYKQGVIKDIQSDCVYRECETGYAHRISWGWTEPVLMRNKPITPRLSDVLYSITLDSAALDYSGFNEWADTYGYDQDSRKAFDIYNVCLSNGLKFRNGLGQKCFTQLQQLMSEY